MFHLERAGGQCFTNISCIFSVLQFIEGLSDSKEYNFTTQIVLILADLKPGEKKMSLSDNRDLSLIWCTDSLQPFSMDKKPLSKR